MAFHTKTQHEAIVISPTDPPELNISLQYVNHWIRERIRTMMSHRMNLTKTGSWAWSEPFLSDYLYLYNLQVD